MALCAELCLIVLNDMEAEYKKYQETNKMGRKKWILPDIRSNFLLLHLYVFMWQIESFPSLERKHTTLRGKFPGSLSK